MALPKLTFVFLCSPFLSPLPHRYQFAVHALWLQGETWESAALAGVLLMLFSAWNVTYSIRSSWKQTVVMHRDRVTSTILIDNWGACFDD